MKDKLKAVFSFLLLFYSVSAFSQSENKALVVPLVDNLKGLANVITVSSSGGDFTDIQSAIDSIGDGEPTFNDPFLILIGPGSYTITNTIVVPDHVSIMGTGPDVTQISGSVKHSTDSETNMGLVSANGLSGISNLSITNFPDTGNGEFGFTIHNFEHINNVVAQVIHFTIDSTTGTLKTILTDSALSTSITNSTVKAIFSSAATGVESIGRLVIENSDIEAFGATNNTGVVGPNANSNFRILLMTNSQASGDTASIVINNADTRVVNTGVEASSVDDNVGGTTNCLNVYNIDTLSPESC